MGPVSEDVQDALTRAALVDQLETERAALVRVLRASAYGLPLDGATDPTVGEGDDPEAEEEWRRSRAALDQVDAALERVGQGTYGTCTDCGVTIPIERLEAMPTASRCVSCEAMHGSWLPFSHA